MNPTISKSRSILSKVVEGYEDIEPCIIAALAMRERIFLVGPHGNGKTVLTKTLARAVDDSGRGYRIFHADKADMISIAGIPDMEHWGKSGRPTFLPSTTAIWGGKVILVDELPRANKERQNYWLEIIEERTFNGLPIDYDTLMATGNDATYQGNFKFDLALLSRFMFVLPAPKFQDVESDTVAAMIKLNLDGGRDVKALSEDLKETIQFIQNKVLEYRKNEAVMDQLITFCGTFTQFLKDKISADNEMANNQETYICPREFAFHFINALLSLGAYYEHQGLEHKFRRAGEDTIKYVFKTRHAGAGDKFQNICDIGWRQLSNMLVDGIDTPAGKMRWKFASAINASQKVTFWRQYLTEVCKVWDLDEITHMAGDTLQQIHKESVGQIGPFWHIMKQEQKVAHVATQVEGFMLTEVARKLLRGYGDPSSKEVELYNKYKNHVVLKPENVSEIIGVNS
jgi:MoxR-like ATPase